MLLNQPLPNNVDIEKYILGCIISDKEYCDYIPQMIESDFYSDDTKNIFNVVSDMYYKKQPVELISVSAKMPGSLNYLADICTDIATTSNFKHYYNQLKVLSCKREIIRRTQEIQDMVMSEEYENAVDLKNNALQKLDIEVIDYNKSNYEIKSIITETLNNVESRMQNKNDEKLFTGFYDLDKMTAGLHGEELTIIAARPSIGKTAYVLQLLRNLAKKGNKCILFSREMSKGQIGERLLSSVSGIDSQRIRFAKSLTDEEILRIGQALTPISQMDLIINDEAVNVQDIRAFCRKLKNKGMLDIIAVDYLQLCRTLKKTQTREREVAEMSWEFKMMSKEFKVPVILLSQLSRDSVKDKREPILSDLRDSGAIEQDADNVMFLHIPQDTDTTQSMFDIEVIIAKQRQGPTGKIYLRYCKSNFNFWGRSNR